MTSQLASLIEEKVKRQPRPPRDVVFIEIIGEVFKSKSMKFIFVFFLILALSFFVIGISDKNNQLLLLSFGTFSFLCSSTPFIYALRITKAIRTGHIEVAVVESVKYLGPVSHDTLDALQNGIARGKWRIPKTGLKEFEVDEPWANKISEGSHVEILITQNFKNIFPLNLQS
ncbi:MAG TPA: hypothetical protein VF181_09615 [Balneolaceae bacterium]